MADAAHDRGQGGHVGGIFAVFHPGAEQVAEDAAEIFVPSVAEEGAGVGQHADEGRQVAEACQRGELGLHAGPVVVEPPGAAELQLAGDAALLEAAHDRAQRRVVVGVEGVENGPGQLIGLVERVEEAGQILDRGRVADGVDAGVRAQRAEDALGIVADDAEVQLHDPALFSVDPAEEHEQRGLELRELSSGQGLACQALLEDGLHSVGVRLSVGHRRQAVVRYAAAQAVKKVRPLCQGLAERGEGVDLAAGCSAERLQIGGIVRLLAGNRLVRTEARPHLDGKAFRIVILRRLRRRICPRHSMRFFASLRMTDSGKLLVPFQRIRRIVGGADDLDVRALNQAPGGELGPGQLLVAQLPDGLGGLAVQRALIAEIVAQLQVAPVIQGVADRQRQGLGPGLELLAVGGVAGDLALVDAEAPHEPPLVVVAAQPDLRDVLKAPVLINLLRAQVAVVVDDGAICRGLVVQPLRRAALQQKIPIHKRLHRNPPFFSLSIPKKSRKNNCFGCCIVCKSCYNSG